MAETEVKSVKLPNGEVISVKIPKGMTNTDIRARLEKSRPDAFAKELTTMDKLVAAGRATTTALKAVLPIIKNPVVESLKVAQQIKIDPEKAGALRRDINERFIRLGAVGAAGVQEGFGNILRAAGTLSQEPIAALRSIVPSHIDAAFSKVESGLGIKMTNPKFNHSFGVGMEDWGKDQAARARMKIEKATPTNLGFWGTASFDASRSLGITVPGLIGAAITRKASVALIPMGAVEYGNSFADAKDAGLSTNDASRYAGINAFIEVVTERIGLKFLLATNVGFFKRLVTSMGGELLGENTATTLQSAMEFSTLHPNATFNDWKNHLPEALLRTTGATVIGTSVQAPIAHGVIRLTQTKEERAIIAEMKRRGKDATKIVEAVKKTEVSKPIIHPDGSAQYENGTLSMTLTPSSKEPGKWQLTTWDQGLTLPDETFGTVEEGRARFNEYVANDQAQQIADGLSSTIPTSTPESIKAAVRVVQEQESGLVDFEGDVERQRELMAEYAIDQFEANIREGRLTNAQRKLQMQDMVQNRDRRVLISHFMEGTYAGALSAEEQAMASLAKAALDTGGQVLQDLGQLETFIERFVPHYWKGAKTNKVVGLVASLVNNAKKQSLGGFNSFSKKSRHALLRTIASLEEGKTVRGLEAVTEDITELVELYTNDVLWTLEVNKLVESMKTVNDHAGNPLLVNKEDAPSDYIRIDHPALQKQRVVTTEDGDKIRVPQQLYAHPDVADQLQFILFSENEGIVSRSLLLTNFIMKRMLVGFSGFHVNALIESMIGAGIITKIPNLFGKSTSALELYKNSRLGSELNKLIRGGLVLTSLGEVTGAPEDLGLDRLYQFTEDMQSQLSRIPGVGKVTQPLINGFNATNKAFDRVLWGHTMTSLKIWAALKNLEKLGKDNIRLHQRNPTKNPLMTEDQLYSAASAFTNKAFGGLDWRRLSNAPKSKAMRKVLREILKPSGGLLNRKTMQLLLFAPDWTVANILIIKGALPSIVGGANTAAERNLYRWYAARMSVMYIVLGSIIQMLFGDGDPIWENPGKGKRIDRIYLKDGRQMVVSKQLMEPYHWVSKPHKTLLNKAGMLPKFVAEQLTTSKYLTSDGSPRMYPKDIKFWDSPKSAATVAGFRTMHLLGKFTPIVFQQMGLNADNLMGSPGAKGFQPGEAAAGFLGHPIYGRTNESLERRRLERRQERRKNRRRRNTFKKALSK